MHLHDVKKYIDCPQQEVDELSLTEVADVASSLKQHFYFEESLRYWRRYNDLLLWSSLGREEKLQAEAKVYLEEAGCYEILGHFERAIRSLKKLMESSEPAVYEEQVEAGLACARISSHKGLYKEGEQYLNYAFSIAQKLPTHWKLARIYCARSNTSSRNGEQDVAFQWLRKAQDLIDGYNPLEVPQRVFMELQLQKGLVSFRQGQNQQSQGYFTQALSIARQNGFREQAHALRYLGIIRGARGEHSRALENHLEALELCLRSKYKYALAKVYDSLGRTFLALNCRDEAIYSFKKSEKICRSIGAYPELATIYGRLGQVYFMGEDYEVAISYFQRDLELTKESGNYYALAYSYRNLGRAYTQLEALGEAMTNLKESLGLFQYVDDNLNVSRVYMDMCDCQIRLGETSEARESLSRAREGFVEFGQERELAFCDSLEGALLRLEKDRTKALQLLNRALENLPQASAVWMAETFFQKGLVLQEESRLDEAIEAYQQAHLISKRQGWARLSGRYLTCLEKLAPLSIYRLWANDLREQEQK